MRTLPLVGFGIALPSEYSSVVPTGTTEPRASASVAELDPLRLLEEIRAIQHHLAALASGQTPHLVARPDSSLDGFLSGLATAWQQGEVRATHRLAPRPARDWRTRKDPFETVWPRVLAWLEEDPDRVGRELFERLQCELPGVFHDGQLRTLQRRIKHWRMAAARELIFASSHDAA